MRVLRRFRFLSSFLLLGFLFQLLVATGALSPASEKDAHGHRVQICSVTWFKWVDLGTFASGHDDDTGSPVHANHHCLLCGVMVADLPLNLSVAVPLDKARPVIVATSRKTFLTRIAVLLPSARAPPVQLS